MGISLSNDEISCYIQVFAILVGPSPHHFPTRVLGKIHMTRNTWMQGLTRRRWKKQSKFFWADWRNKNREALRTWKPFCQSCPALNQQQDGLCQSQRPLRLAFSPNQAKTWWICSRRRNYDCTVMHKITGTHIEKDIPSYPILDWVYLSICVVLAGGPLMNSKIWFLFCNKPTSTLPTWTQTCRW